MNFHPFGKAATKGAGGPFPMKSLPHFSVENFVPACPRLSLARRSGPSMNYGSKSGSPFVFVATCMQVGLASAASVKEWP